MAKKKTKKRAGKKLMKNGSAATNGRKREATLWDYRRRLRAAYESIESYSGRPNDEEADRLRAAKAAKALAATAESFARRIAQSGA